MTDDEQLRHRVVLEFENCAATIVSRAIMAAVDQLCATVDVAVDLLECLEVPVVEAMLALHDLDVTTAAIDVDAAQLVIDVEVRRRVPPAADLLGASADIIQSFFEISVSKDLNRVELTGSLR